MSDDRPLVLQLIANLSVGGAEMHLLHLVRGLVDVDEFRVVVAYLRESPDEARPMMPDFRELNVPLHDLRMGPLADPRAAFRVRALLGNLRPDLVHTHLAPAHLYGIPLARMGGIPVVSSVHNLETHFESGIRRPVYRVLLGRAHRVIAISRAVRDVLVGRVGLADDQVRTIYYGLPAGPAGLSGGGMNGTGLSGPGPRVTAVGRLAEQKGHRYLIEAMTEVGREFPDAQVLIVGHDGGRRSDLQSLIDNSGLSETVTLAGYRDDAAGILAASDLFVLPSLWEGFGLVLLEAMAAGRPVVASDIPPINEIVVDGETGVLVPPADRHSLARAITGLLADPARARRMGEAGKERALELFTVERMVEETQTVYREVLRDTGGG